MEKKAAWHVRFLNIATMLFLLGAGACRTASCSWRFLPCYMCAELTALRRVLKVLVLNVYEDVCVWPKLLPEGKTPKTLCLSLLSWAWFLQTMHSATCRQVELDFCQQWIKVCSFFLSLGPIMSPGAKCVFSHKKETMKLYLFSLSTEYRRKWSR